MFKLHFPIPGLLFAMWAGASFGQTPIIPVKVQTQVVSSTTTGQSVYAWIQNTGTDTLRNITYVWYMDWADHGAALVPELDYCSISGVTASSVLRPDYIAEARYSLGANKIAPGQTIQLNTRFHMKDWSAFNTGNDWSSLVAKTSMADNPYASVFSGSVRIWGNPEQRVGQAVAVPQVQVRTVASYVNNNTIGLEVHVANTGTVPVTNVVAQWISSTLGRTASVVAELDYTSADTTRLRVLPADGTRVPVDIDLGGTIIGVGLEKILRIRLHSSDWTNTDWTQDWSYTGVSTTAYNPRVAVEVRGYPQSGLVPQDMDSDNDGWSDAVETALGNDPKNAANHPTGATMTGGYIQDTSVSHVVTYNASSLAGYSTRTSLPLTVEAGGVQGVAPVISISTGATTPVFQGAVQVGKVLEISGTIRPGHALAMPIPLPDGLPVTLPSQVQVIHLVNGNWQREIVTDVRNGAAYTTISSFSPVVVGLVQSTNTIAAGGNHGLWIRNGRPWSAGQNDRGQLGNGASSTSLQSGFGVVHWADSVPVVAVSAGLWHSLALDALGRVWAWGDNRWGQCGRGVTGNASKDLFLQPVLVLDAGTGVPGVVQVAAGDTASYALRADGKVLSWGANSRGQLGQGAPASGSAPLFNPVPGFVAGRDSSGANIPIDSFCQVAAGARHAVGLRYSSEVRAWGANDLNQRGDADSSNRHYSTVIPINLYAYGSDTLRYTTGVQGGTGGFLVRPWYAAPSLVEAGGNMSYAKLYLASSANQAARNLVWGANDSEQIQSPASKGGIRNPVSVSGVGRGSMGIGASHLVQLYDAGFSYYAPAQSVIHWYPVQCRGANGFSQSDPITRGGTVPSWKEIQRTSVPHMISSAVAAGAQFSMSYDNGQDSVYRWGSDWGAGAGVKAMASAGTSFLQIVWPKEMDTIPRSLTSISVNWILWAKDGSYVPGSSSVAVPTNCTDSTLPCVISVNQNGFGATVHVIRRTMAPMSLPLASTVDRRLGQSLSFRLAIPWKVDSAKLLMWSLRNPQRVLYQASLGGLSKVESSFLTPSWKDSFGNSETIPDGSYGLSMAYVLHGQARWDTVQITTIGAEDYPNWSQLSSAIPLGGVDSFRVELPRQGLAQGYLGRDARYSTGVRVMGAWALRDSGDQIIEVWNLSDDSESVICDTISASFVKWRFRPVLNGVRFSGASCSFVSSIGAFNVDAFQSEIPSFLLSSDRACELMWTVSDKGVSSIATAVFASSNSGIMEYLMDWQALGSFLKGGATNFRAGVVDVKNKNAFLDVKTIRISNERKDGKEVRR